MQQIRDEHTAEADVVYHWTSSMQPKSLYVYSIISLITLHARWRKLQNKTHISCWARCEKQLNLVTLEGHEALSSSQQDIIRRAKVLGDETVM